ncbi:nodulation-signaling pathway 1 protein-like [Phalaenopsis equestris]|uniref:nodulation-signaling pathway 1 protein-like n=1 Tax=Phalaenopsis equestris TaxID=78828 RepID=UPI0009E491C1|nr:nodulation-signaling pathway 1 protein-like [Phalaenopsis equestris]
MADLPLKLLLVVSGRTAVKWSGCGCGSMMVVKKGKNKHHPPNIAAVAPPSTTNPQQITPKSESPKKRKLQSSLPAAQRRRTGNEEKKTHGGVNGGSREARWAEQLLNPLAAAMESGNVSRAQHLLYVLQELASPTGDANHRLAFYGLKALTRCLTGGFADMEPKGFRSALIKFHEVSPWFAFPNCLANAAIVSASVGGRRLHVVDAGVSHGVQWPTMLEALTRRPGEPPAMVKLTVVDAGSGGPFGSAPEGYDFGPQLMRYAKSIDVDLIVERGEMAGRRRRGDEERVVVCAQFRAGRAGVGFLRAVREMEPDLVVLSEVEEGEGDGLGLGLGFGSRVEAMWRFLESTNAAFKGRECEERRVVEREAARVLEEGREGGRERWKEKMEGLGFREEEFGEEVLEVGRALLRKYDGNWEMMRGSEGGGVMLCWKGQSVSFCSLWKPVRHKTTATEAVAAAAGAYGNVIGHY